MKDTVFKFKQFSVEHHQSSMKVGVDAVLLGAWAGEEAKNIIDIGTGCGVIALILAQRFPQAEIIGIDIDIPSVEESGKNFKCSPWNNRLKSLKSEFPKDLLESGKKYDLIVSNPPYFRSGVVSPQTRREIARHQDTLSVFSLIENSPSLLNEDGRLSIIFPIIFMEEVKTFAQKIGLFLVRECRIRDSEKKPEKRVMMEFIKRKNQMLFEERDTLILFNNDQPSEDYKKLCGELYLKF